MEIPARVIGAFHVYRFTYREAGSVVHERTFLISDLPECIKCVLGGLSREHLAWEAAHPGTAEASVPSAFDLTLKLLAWLLPIAGREVAYAAIGEAPPFHHLPNCS